MHLAVCRPTLSRNSDSESGPEWELFTALLRALRNASALSGVLCADAEFKSEPARLTDRYTSDNARHFSVTTR